MHTTQMNPLYNISETVLFFNDLLQFKITRDEKSYITLKIKITLPSNVLFIGQEIEMKQRQLRIVIK